MAAHADDGISAEDAAALGAAALGCQVGSARRAGSRTVYFVDLDDGTTVVVKVARADRAASPAVEASVYEACRRSGVSVPEVLAVTEAPEAIIMRAMRGHPLSKDRSSRAPAVWAAAGADVRAMHEIEVTGFGPLVPCDGGAAGVSARSSPVVDVAREDGVKALAERGLLTARPAARLSRRYEELESHLTSITTGRASQRPRRRPRLRRSRRRLSRHHRLRPSPGG